MHTKFWSENRNKYIYFFTMYEGHMGNIYSSPLSLLTLTGKEADENEYTSTTSTAS